ncbi:MAG: transposase [Lacibacter sp.]
MFKRKKYNYAFRLQCVEAVVKGNRSVREVAAAKGFEESNLRLWVGFYEMYGKAGLKPRGKQHYDPAFKRQVLETIDRELLSLRSACVRFNIPSESVIISWRTAFELKGEAGLNPQCKGRPSTMKHPIKRKPRKSAKPLTREEELLRENEYLRAENELLKKLQALVQTSKKQKPS